MAALQNAELQKLAAARERLRQDFRQRQRALRAEMQEREDELNDELCDGLAALDRQRDQLYLNTSAASPSGLRQTSTTFVSFDEPMLEPVTSSSPMATAPAQKAAPAAFLEAASSQLDGLAGQAVSTHTAEARSRLFTTDALTSRQDHQTAPAEVVAAAQPTAAEPMAAELDPDDSASPDHAQSDSRYSLAAAATELAAAASAATELAAAPSSPDSTVSPEPEEMLEIDVSHVVPIAAQRFPGTTTYMLSQPRSRAAGKGCL